MLQKITGFHTDEENHWVAELECGHGQHMRHDPPWMERPWVTTPEGRQTRLGQALNCVRCDDLAEIVIKQTLVVARKAMVEAYENAGLSGLCAEGRWELAVEAVNNLDHKAVLNSFPSSE